MTETKAVKLRPKIRELAEDMERRMRGRKDEILAGEITHWKQMDEAELLEAAQYNLNHFRSQLTPERALEAAADVANYLNFLRLRIAAPEADTEAEYPRPDADERGPHGE